MTQPFEVCGCFLRYFRPRTKKRPDDIKQVVQKYSEKGTMSIDNLREFLKDIQGQADTTMKDAQAIFERAKHLNLLQDGRLRLWEYLLSDHLNLPLGVVPDDMKAPLSHYYIYTGHNSYLTGNQFTSDSSVKPIIRALQKGVRVIELDLWPNATKTGINVCHGRTLTSSVKLSNCLKAIKDHAFHASEYPVVITFEDHLNKKLRDKVARMVKNTFQNMLFQPNEDFSQLPSPAELKKKIIISTKPPNESSESQTVDDKRYSENILPAAIVNCWKSRDGLEDDNKEEDVQDEVPEYRDLIAIHAVKHKGDLDNSLRVDPDKVKRLSLSEQELTEACEKHGQQIVRFTQRNLLRIYPKGTRLDSSNYNPFDGWKHGAQMVAFNMQGYDHNLWWMQGMFRANNGCGYVKKPSFLCDENSIFNPNEVKKILKVKVYMGEGWSSEFHHAHFDYCSPPDLYAKVGIVGYDGDYTPESKTHAIEDDWWPIWDQEFVFRLRVPQLALLTVEVKDKDTTKKNEFGGQTCLPVFELRNGIRCVPLYNRRGDRYKFIKLLMRFEFTTP